MLNIAEVVSVILVCDIDDILSSVSYNIPAIQAVVKQAIVPATSARSAHLASTGRFLGANVEIPPI